MQYEQDIDQDSVLVFEGLPVEVRSAAEILLEKVNDPESIIGTLRFNVAYINTFVFAFLFAFTKGFVNTLPDNYTELRVLFEIGLNYTLITPLLFYTYLALNEISRKERKKLFGVIEKLLSGQINKKDAKYLSEFLSSIESSIPRKDMEIILRRLGES